jgi:nicotinamide-nucleotide amidase
LRAEVIAVGTELLLGDIADTNAQKISKTLAEAGVDMMFHTAVGDNLERIASCIAVGIERSDVIILTGGLGPTHDDLTREAISSATDRPLSERPELVEWLENLFASLGRKMADSNRAQAFQPEGADPIPNPRGTAPGIRLLHEGTLIYALPGVPHEMEGMLSEAVLPELAEKAGGARVTSKILKVVGEGESDIAARLADVIEDLDRDPVATIALLASAGEVKIRITAKDRSAEAAADRISSVEQRCREVLGKMIYGADDDRLEAVVASMLTERGFTLAIAESVTGGQLADRLVSVPGASRFFKGGFVVYSREAKEEVGVTAETLAKHGTVSPETTRELAEAVRMRLATDIGIGITGEAGPDPLEAAVGTVHLGLAHEGKTKLRTFVAPSDRERVRRWASQAALSMIRLHLLDAD